MRRTAHGHTSQPGGNVWVERGCLPAAGYGACRQHPASNAAQRRSKQAGATALQYEGHPHQAGQRHLARDTGLKTKHAKAAPSI